MDDCIVANRLAERYDEMRALGLHTPDAILRVARRPDPLVLRWTR